jgi:hypothetical protein
MRNLRVVQDSITRSESPRLDVDQVGATMTSREGGSVGYKTPKRASGAMETATR